MADKKSLPVAPVAIGAVALGLFLATLSIRAPSAAPEQQPKFKVNGTGGRFRRL